MYNTFSLIYDCTFLSRGMIYFINGTFYRYLYSNDSVRTQYFFEPLPGQRKRADLKLNQKKARAMVYETGIRAMKHLAIGQNAIQLSLF